MPLLQIIVTAAAIFHVALGRNVHQAITKIGFHAARNQVTGKETGSGNALIGAYLNKLRLPYPAVFYITQASPESITWLRLILHVARRDARKPRALT